MAEEDGLIQLKIDLESLVAQAGKAKDILKGITVSNVSTSSNSSFKALKADIDSASVSTSALQAKIEKMSSTQSASFSSKFLGDPTTAIRTSQMYEGLFDKIAQTSKKVAMDQGRAFQASAKTQEIAAQEAADAQIAQLRRVEVAQRANQDFLLGMARNQRNPVAAGRVAQENEAERQAQSYVGFWNKASQAKEDAETRATKNASAIQANALQQERQAAIDNLIYIDRLKKNSAQNFAGNVNQAGGVGAFAKQTNVPLGQIKEARAEAEAMGASFKSFPTAFDRIAGRLSILVPEFMAIQAIITGIEEVTRTWGDSLKRASEFQVQGTLFQAYQQARKNADLPTEPVSNNQLLESSIMLATKWGDKVSDVTQDMSLWYKQTGDLNAALAMTSTALEFQAATGTHLEDTYRTLTAMSSQLSGISMGKLGAGTFDLSKSQQFLAGITSFATLAGAGLHQINSDEKELSGTTSNSAEIFITAMEKDGAALKSLGYNASQIMALNASLIQSFGNTGSGAEEAAEKISRLAGGLAGLSNPSKNAALAKAGIDLSKLNVPKDDAGKLQVLDQLAASYKKLDRAQQDYLATQTAGNRQYEALMTVIKILTGSQQLESEASKNMGLEQQLAAQMMETYEFKVKKLQAAFEGLQIKVGQEFLPDLTKLVDFMAGPGVSAMSAIGMGVQSLANLFGSLQMSIAPVIGALQTVIALSPIGAINSALGAIGRSQGEDMQAHQLYGSDYNTYKSAKDKMAQDPMWAAEISPLTKDEQRVVKQSQRYGREISEFNKDVNTGPVNAQGNAPGKGKSAVYFNRGEYDVHKFHEEKAPWFQEQTQNVRSKHVDEFLKFNQDSKSVQDALKRATPSSESNVPGLLADPKSAGSSSGTTKGMEKDYSLFGQTLQDTALAYRQIDAAMKQNEETAQTALSGQERLNSAFGLTDSNLTKTISLINQKQNADNKEITSLSGQASEYDKLANSAYKTASKQKPGSDEWRGWLTQANDAEEKAMGIRQQIQGLKDDVSSLDFKKVEEAFANITFDIEKGTKAFEEQSKLIKDQYDSTKNIGAKRNVLGQETFQTNSFYSGEISNIKSRGAADIAKISDPTIKSEAQAKLNDLIKQEIALRNEALGTIKKENETLDQTLQDQQKSLNESLNNSQSKMLDDLSKLSGGKDISGLKSQIEAQKELNAATLKYNEEMQQFSGTSLAPLIAQTYEATQAQVQLDMATAQYEDRLKKLQDSPIFKGISTALTDIANSISNTITNNMFGDASDKQQIADMNETITLIQQQKSEYEELYSSTRYHSAMDHANEVAQIDMINQQIAAEEKLKKAKEDRVNNPSFLNKTIQGVSKSIIDDYVKQIQQQLETGLSKNPQQDQATKALQDYKTTTDGTLATSINSYKTSTQSFTTAINTFKEVSTALDQSLNSFGTKTKANVLGTSTSSVGMVGNNIDALDSYNATSNSSSSSIDDLVGELGATNGAPWQQSATTVTGNTQAVGQMTQTTAQSTTAVKGLTTSLTSLSGLFTALLMQGGSGTTAGTAGSLLSAFGGSLKGGSSGLGSILGTGGNILSAFGSSTDSGIGSILGAAAGSIIPGIGTALGSAIGGLVGKLFGPKYSETNNPDMFADSGYAQEF